MIISHKKKFIYIAVPKTGTTSIEKVLQKYNQEKVPKHLFLSEIHKYCQININKYFIFCFVRNPFDMLVSFYFQYKKNFTKDYDTPERRFLWEFCNNNTFEAFVELAKYQKNFFNKKERARINFIGRFENLQNDFDSACEIIGIPKERLPVENKNYEKKHYSEYYTQRARDFAQNIFQEGLNFFEYSFEEKEYKHTKDFSKK